MRCGEGLEARGAIAAVTALSARSNCWLPRRLAFSATGANADRMVCTEDAKGKPAGTGWLEAARRRWSRASALFSLNPDRYCGSRRRAVEDGENHYRALRQLGPTNQTGEGITR